MLTSDNNWEHFFEGQLSVVIYSCPFDNYLFLNPLSVCEKVLSFSKNKLLKFVTKNKRWHILYDRMVVITFCVQ
jgi:hypothetical protein